MSLASSSYFLIEKKLSNYKYVFPFVIGSVFIKGVLILVKVGKEYIKIDPRREWKRYARVGQTGLLHTGGFLSCQ